MKQFVARADDHRTSPPCGFQYPFGPGPVNVFFPTGGQVCQGNPQQKGKAQDATRSHDAQPPDIAERALHWSCAAKLKPRRRQHTWPLCQDLPTQCTTFNLHDSKALRT